MDGPWGRSDLANLDVHLEIEGCPYTRLANTFSLMLYLTHTTYTGLYNSRPALTIVPFSFAPFSIPFQSFIYRCAVRRSLLLEQA